MILEIQQFNIKISSISYSTCALGRNNSFRCLEHYFYADTLGEEGKFPAFPIPFHEYNVSKRDGYKSWEAFKFLIGNIYHDSRVLYKRNFFL